MLRQFSKVAKLPFSGVFSQPLEILLTRNCCQFGSSQLIETLQAGRFPVLTGTGGATQLSFPDVLGKAGLQGVGWVSDQSWWVLYPSHTENVEATGLFFFFFREKVVLFIRKPDEETREEAQMNLSNKDLKQI